MSVARKKFKSMASHEMSTKPGGESNDRNDFGFSNNGNSVTEYCDEKIETHSHPGLILESSNFDEPVSVPRVIALPPDKPEVRMTLRLIDYHTDVRHVQCV